MPQDAPEPAARIGHQPPEDPVWSFSDVILIAVFAFFSLVFLLVLAVALAHSFPYFRDASTIKLAENVLILVPTQILWSLLVVVFMVQILRLKYHVNFAAAICWNRPTLRTAVFAAAGGGGLAILFDIISNLLQKWIPKSLPIDELFRDTRSAYMLSFLGILVAPVVEELFFRGFLYPVLARATGVIAGVLLTAAAFAVIHASQLAQAWIPLMVIFGAGIAFTTVRARTKSVATTVLMHMGYNATIFGWIFISTQGFRHLEHG
jgi:membrane protease YdiL (CAAX protease family)